MICISCVVILFYLLRTNTENTSFQYNEHRWYQFKNKHLLLLLLQLMFKVSSISTHTGSETSRVRHWFTATQMTLWSKLHHSYQSLHQVAYVILECWRRQFSSVFFKKSNISALDRLVVVKFHTNIADRWLFMIQRKILAIILYS